MALQMIEHRALVLGDKIVLNPDQVRFQGRAPKLESVASVQHYACSQRGTHANGGCYTWSIPVAVWR